MVNPLKPHNNQWFIKQLTCGLLCFANGGNDHDFERLLMVSDEWLMIDNGLRKAKNGR